MGNFPLYHVLCLLGRPVNSIEGGGLFDFYNPNRVRKRLGVWRGGGAVGGRVREAVEGWGVPGVPRV